MFSDYVIEEFTGFLVTGKKVTIVDRRHLALIREEMSLQLSGDVSDESAQAIGRQLGAQSIVSGSLTNMGNLYRFRIKVINVETAAVEAQKSYNLQNDAQVAFLLTGKQSVPPPASPPPAPNSSTAQTPAPVQPVVGDQSRPGLYANGAYIPAQPDNAPKPSIPANSPGLYVNGAYQGQMELSEALDWIEMNVKANGAYTIVLGKDEKISNVSLSYRNMQVSVTLKGSGSERKVQYDTAKPAYPLITVGPGVTFTLEKGAALVGQKDSQSLVRVEGGTFTMNNGTISGNSTSYGGGVYVYSGTFTMNNGTISGNSISGRGSGVFMASGTFTMNGGIISGNSTDSYGGGVYVAKDGVFVKSATGGIIYGSDAPGGQANKAYHSGYGHAVYVSDRNKKRDTTARVTTGLDSRKSGADGGWE